MTTPSPANEPVGFDALGLHEGLVKAVMALGYEEPTPIQREAIPHLLAGRDLLGQAGTGTGKTAAFALPLVDRLMQQKTSSKRRGTRGLILVPTRELAMQVAEAIHKYAKRTTLTVVPLYGGAPMDQQIRALARGADIAVATPGRALDHLRRKTLTLEAIETVVLDEADEMLDMGFAEDLDAILSATPATRQTALFAATMAPRIASIAERHLKSPARITIKSEKRAAGTMPRVRQVAFIVSRGQKGPALGRILEFEDPASAIVFCRTRIEVDELTETLKSHGYGAQALHGGMEQRQRDRVMQSFRQKKTDVLVATDVAARGLDIEHVSHVINYDIPTAAEVYVHRIGRTGRIGREGVAITLADPREQRMLRHIEALTKQKIEIAPLPTEDALRVKRLDVTRTALKDRLTSGAGDLAHTRTLVTALAEEFDLLDIAAAAVAMIHDERESSSMPAPAVSVQSDGHRDGGRRAADGGRVFRPGGDDDDEGAPGPMTVLFVGAGHKGGVRPGDLVGAIAGEAHINARQIGNIRVQAGHSLVEVPERLADRIVTALRRTKIRGQSVEVKRHGGEIRNAHPRKSEPRQPHVN